MSKKKKQKQAEAVPLTFTPQPVVLNHTAITVAVVAGTAFLINFIVYLYTLAPGVTFEDSGELITAARFLGVPHQPGYPLFTLFGHLFSMLPFGSVAWRVNLMSAFFSAGACAWVCLATIMLIERTFTESKFFREAPVSTVKICLYGAGLCGSVIFGTSREAWEQAIIAEVYGLNSFLVGMVVAGMLYLLRQTDPARKRVIFLLMAYVTGLSFANHTTSLMLVSLLGVFLLIYERPMLCDWLLMLKSAGLFILGSSVYLYLLIASRKNPPVDWGDPETLTNFIRTISRHQYRDEARQTIGSFLEQFGYFCKDELLVQWVPIVLLFAVAGLIVLALKNRKTLALTAVLLFLTMPVTTYMTNFPVSPLSVRVENGALVSVFYIPAYLTVAILAATGLFAAGVFIWRLHRSAPLLLCLATLIAAVGTAMVRTMPSISMRHFTCATDYCYNLSMVIPQKSLYFVNWDPFCFPLIYYQFVEKKRPDLIVLDEKLLRRSWYVRWLQRYYPEFTGKVQRETAAFLNAVAPFEDRKAYNGNYIQACYIAMINAMIDMTLADGNDVYFAYTPESAIMRSYQLESQFVAYKYIRGGIDRSITDAALKMAGFTDSTAFRDRMAEHVREYYGNLYGMRGLRLEESADPAGAQECFRKAHLFFKRGSQQSRFLEAKLAER